MTFCHEIRFALTPIFGPNFTKDCLNKNHARFGTFKISPETVRNATLEADNHKTITNAQPSRAARRPTFRTASPFDTESSESAPTSPALSPKTSAPVHGFTAINKTAAAGAGRGSKRSYRDSDSESEWEDEDLPLLARNFSAGGGAAKRIKHQHGAAAAATSEESSLAVAAVARARPAYKNAPPARKYRSPSVEAAMTLLEMCEEDGSCP